MSLTMLIILLAVGLVLMLIEAFVLPGLGFAGIVGLLLMIIGIYMAFGVSTTVGIVTTLLVVLVTAYVLWKFLQADTWKRFAINDSIYSKMNTFNTDKIKLGAEGVCLTRLNPSGRAKINGEILEVAVENNFLDANTPIRVVSLSSNKIIVESL
jgi:membrane-bound ClpP family serine protease